MLIIPAIDLKEGQCVRLFQGDMSQSTVYGENPLATALQWEEQGARLIHLVDLDGAMSGKPEQEETIRSIARALTVPVQAGGGIRTMGAIAMYLNAGISRVILGTAACENPDFLKEACGRFEGRIGAGIDSKDGWVQTRGWKNRSKITAVDMAKRAEDSRASMVICTDIARDGTENGVNVEAIRTILDAVSIPVIASGGVRNLKDIIALKALGTLHGVIVGKALYTGGLRLPEATMEADR